MQTSSSFEEAVNSALPHLANVLYTQNKLNPTFETEHVETSTFYGHEKTVTQTLTHENPIPQKLHSKETDLDEVRAKFKAIFSDTPLRWIAPVSVIKEMCVKSKKMYFWRYMTEDGTILTKKPLSTEPTSRDIREYSYSHLFQALFFTAFFTSALILFIFAIIKSFEYSPVIWTDNIKTQCVLWMITGNIPIQIWLFRRWFKSYKSAILDIRYFDIKNSYSNNNATEPYDTVMHKITFITAPNDFIETIQKITAHNQQPVYLCHRESFTKKHVETIKAPSIPDPDPIVGIIIKAKSGAEYLCAMNMYGQFPEEEKLDTLYTNIYVNQFMTQNFGENWKN